ncbi:Pentapeptide repeat-containing protein [Promicromonospora umidemergens]|uniref:Pentapeptide repeat protein n=1 Tax=Promicromonospora umidemergens TaxID=629679 RepID=A0ABP8WQY9_9MICO|nr:pentapeptide repeat-containing protein [Promicromonospora umidemergens]MCP2283431.1 Pentapeptide repeat-containing protein [Promicromonospora umidemergens]
MPSRLDPPPSMRPRDPRARRLTRRTGSLVALLREERRHTDERQRKDLAAWRRELKSVIAVELVAGLTFSVLAAGALVLWQDQRENQRQAAAEALEDEREEHAEVLANVQYIRDVLAEDKPRDFRYLNLRGADLGGFDLGCEVRVVAKDDEDAILYPLDPVSRAECADFSGSDLTGANLSGTMLTGALMHDVTFAPRPSEDTYLAGAWITGRIDADLDGADLRGAVVRLEEEATTGHLALRNSTVEGGRLMDSGWWHKDRSFVSAYNVSATGAHVPPGTEFGCMNSDVVHAEVCDDVAWGWTLDQRYFGWQEQEKLYALLGCTVEPDGRYRDVECPDEKPVHIGFSDQP